MQLTYEETVWFFSMSIMTVLLTATTSVKQSIIILFTSAFLSKAQEIIQKIDAAPVTLPVSDDIDTYYTSYVQNTIAAMESADELIDF